MAIYPGANWRPLPEANTQPTMIATQVILHTAVSSAPSLYGYFARFDVGLESHFYVSQTGVEQYISTSRQADANRQANVRAISIETWDGGDPDHTPWTPRQMDLLVDLVAWCCVNHGIPVLQCPAWNQPGIGWHVMFGAPGPWTPVSKSCPGRPRIAQMPELIARVEQALSPMPPPPPVQEDDDMMILRDKDDAAAGIWLLSGDTFFHLADTATVSALLGQGVKDVSIAHPDFVAMMQKKDEAEQQLTQINLRLADIQNQLAKT